METLKLPKGQSATFATTLNHGAGAALRAAMQSRYPFSEPTDPRAALALQKAVGMALVELLETFVRAYLTGWSLLDEEGNSIPYVAWPANAEEPRPPEWERIPERTFSKLAIKAQQIWEAGQKDDPKDESSGSDGPTS